MLQCLVCEDWLHAACVGLPHSDDDDDPTKPLRQDDFDQLVCWRCVEHNSDVRRIMTRYAGVDGTGVLLLAPGAMVLGKVRSADDDDESTVKGEGDDEVAGTEPAPVEAAAPREEPEPAGDGKRKAEDQAEEVPAAKRVKAEGEPVAASAIGAPVASSSRSCQAPPVVPAEDSPLVRLERGGSQANVYLEERFMDRWCRCREVRYFSLCARSLAGAKALTPFLPLSPPSLPPYLPLSPLLSLSLLSQCLGMFLKLPFFLEEEEVFEPPEDPDARASLSLSFDVTSSLADVLLVLLADKSTFELGMNHLLTRMPRIQAINSLQAFGGLSDRLKAFFRPHADSGTTITPEHIKSFFDKEKERERGPQ